MKKLLLLLTLFLCVFPMALGQPVYIQLGSDPDSLPLCAAFDGEDSVYVTEYWFKGLYEVNSTTRAVTQHMNIFSFNPYGLLCHNGLVYVSSRGGEFAVFDPETSAVTEIPGLGGQGLILHDGYLVVGSRWNGTHHILNWYNPDTETVEYTITCPARITSLEPDGDMIWAASVTDDKIYQVEDFTFTEVAVTVDRPLGLAVDDVYLYIAENSDLPEEESINCTIVRYNKLTETANTIDLGVEVINQGTYDVFIDPRIGFLWWTDNSGHFGRIRRDTLQKWTYTSLYKFQYFCTATTSEIWFPIHGSAYAAIIPLIEKPEPVGGVLTAKTTLPWMRVGTLMVGGSISLILFAGAVYSWMVLVFHGVKDREYAWLLMGVVLTLFLGGLAFWVLGMTVFP